MNEPKKLLTIGGSDSGGAAGIQADLKTWAALGVYGMSVLTVVTAQNSVRVAGAEFLSADFVTTQLQTVLSDYRADGIKTGFIGKVELIEAIAEQVANRPNIVIDPVLVNHRGESMFSAEITTAYTTHLLPHATITTPNVREAELLSGLPITSLAHLETAAQTIAASADCAVLITGWRMEDKQVDLLFADDITHYLPTSHQDTINTHGSGDTLSSAITAQLACGTGLFSAVAAAQHFTAKAITRAASWQLGAGHGPLWHRHDAMC